MYTSSAAGSQIWLNALDTGGAVDHQINSVSKLKVENTKNTSSVDVVLALGKSLQVTSGANAKSGTVTANGATAVVVSTTAVTANSVICYGLKTVGGTPAAKPFESAVVPGTSFSVKAAAGDTSVYNWVILDLI